MTIAVDVAISGYYPEHMQLYEANGVRFVMGMFTAYPISDFTHIPTKGRVEFHPHHDIVFSDGIYRSADITLWALNKDDVRAVAIALSQLKSSKKGTMTTVYFRDESLAKWRNGELVGELIQYKELVPGLSAEAVEFSRF